MNTDPNESTTDATLAEIHRVCGILKSVAERFPVDSPESLAIRDAALAFSQVQLHNALKKSYEKARAAFGGELTEEMKADLRKHGIEPDDLDSSS